MIQHDKSEAKARIVEELYNAFEAMDDDDLCYARASIDRAKAHIIEAWQSKNKRTTNDE